MKLQQRCSKGISVKYYVCWSDEAKEITPDNCQKILKNLRDGWWKNIYLTNNPDLEVDIMELESGDGLFALQYIRDNTGMVGEQAAWFLLPMTQSIWIQTKKQILNVLMDSPSFAESTLRQIKMP